MTDQLTFRQKFKLTVIALMLANIWVALALDRPSSLAALSVLSILIALGEITLASTKPAPDESMFWSKLSAFAWVALAVSYTFKWLA